MSYILPTAGILTYMQSIDCKPTVGFVLGKYSCFEPLNNRVSFHMHHHNVLSTEKSLLADPNFRTSCPCPRCAKMMHAVDSDFFSFSGSTAVIIPGEKF